MKQALLLFTVAATLSYSASSLATLGPAINCSINTANAGIENVRNVQTFEKDFGNYHVQAFSENQGPGRNAIHVVVTDSTTKAMSQTIVMLESKANLHVGTPDGNYIKVNCRQ